jgi:hypothetical protein
MQKKIGGKKITKKVFAPVYKSGVGLPKNWAVRSSGVKKINPVSRNTSRIATPKKKGPLGLGWGP